MTIYNETIKKLLNQAVEFHVHFAPDGLTKRKNDAFELLKEAKEVGMRAVVLKNKSFGTGAIAQLANKHCDGARAIGGITLDSSVGGINPEAVAIEAAMGSKIVWMPTYSSKNDPHYMETEKHKIRNGLMIVDQNGQLLPEIIEVLEIIKENNMILATGHISRDEIFTLFDKAIEIGINKLVVNHPLTPSVGTRLSLSDQIELSKLGAYMDHCWVATMPKHSQLPVTDYITAIRKVGVEKCIMSTDFGQIHNPTPLEGFQDMVQTLLQEEFKLEEIEQMIKKNPAQLLDIDKGLN
ncbi:DUF6282 family protein [Robertmurraya massiliosenegalensis]|uniref:DUF6282 family protein n=1 Tax=Robertmurraya massiliosenegalensis TaxID=1287657 RepID=UPI0002EFD1FD|nr:DUF6282 family protein [Robertmurraya massiliosenegalensis]